MNDSPRDRPHLYISGGGQTEQYRRPAQAIRTPALPRRDRAAHADALSASIGVALEAARAQLAARASAVAEGVPGFYLQIEVPVGEKAVIDQLGNRQKQIEVVAVREPTAENPSVTASVFVPATAEVYYQEKVEAYRTQETRTGRPKTNP